MWHIHRFTEQERMFTGCVRLTSVENMHVVDFVRLVLGVTTIISKCCICGKVQTVEVSGDARRAA